MTEVAPKWEVPKLPFDVVSEAQGVIDNVRYSDDPKAFVGDTLAHVVAALEVWPSNLQLLDARADLERIVGDEQA